MHLDFAFTSYLHEQENAKTMQKGSPEGFIAPLLQPCSCWGL